MGLLNRTRGPLSICILIFISYRAVAVWPLVPKDQHIENEFQLLRSERLTFTSNLEAAEYTLNVTPTLIDDDELVTLSFTAVTPSEGDWIGAYSPVPASDADLRLTVPIKLAWCDVDLGYLGSGSGTLRMRLTAAYRSSVAFYYFTGAFAHQRLVGRAPEIVSFTPASLTAPLLPRIMPSGDPDVVRVMWGSLNATSPQVRVCALRLE